MIRTHDFVNGFYYQDPFTKETISEEEYYSRQKKEKQIEKNKLHLLIRHAECIINNTKFYYDMLMLAYAEIPQPKNTIILFENEYLKLEKRAVFYRKIGGNYYAPNILVNKKINNLDNIQEIFDFFVCIQKGYGKIYTKEEFIEKFIKNL